VFAKALEIPDTKAMAYMYSMPCTLLSDDTTMNFNDNARLEGFFNQGMSAYRQFGVVKVHHEVWSKHRLTDKIVLVKVRWHYFDENDALIYYCDYEYIMKLEKNNDLKIAMSISLNEKQKLEEWKAKTGMSNPA